MAKPTALGCYIFAGGFTLGVREHFRVLAHFEEGNYGVATFKKNQPGIPVYTEPATWPTNKYKRVDFVYANPPCAPWSLAGHRRGRANTTKWIGDARVACVEKTFGVLQAVRPKVWAWESVQRAWTNGRPFVDTLMQRAHDLGYSTTVLLVQGTRLGLPSQRPRFFLLAHRIALYFSEPSVKHVTVRQALKQKGIKATPRPPLGCEKEVIKYVKPGERFRYVYNRMHAARVKRLEERGKIVKGRPSFLKVRLAWDMDYAPVLTGGATHYHPDEDRYLSVSESAALCGYPPAYEFVGPLSMQYKQIAQCVTPPVGRWLAEEVAFALRRNEVLRKPKAYLVDVQRAPMTIEEL